MLGKVRKSTLMETSNPEIVMANADLNGLGYGNISVEDSQIAGANLHNYEWKRERVGNSTFQSPLP